MTNDLPELKCEIFKTLTQLALEGEKESFHAVIESFENHSKRKLLEAERIDADFMARLAHGASLVREHFSQIGGEK